MQLVLANSQSELSPLERGMHALQATERGSKTGRSVKAYAEAIGRSQQAVAFEVAAAKVAGAVTDQYVTALQFLEYAPPLAAIHAAPACTWALLVEPPSCNWCWRTAKAN